MRNEADQPTSKQETIVIELVINQRQRDLGAFVVGRVN